MAFLHSRASLTVDSDLLECYRSINDDISELLVSKSVRAIRQSDLDRTIKCEIQQTTPPQSDNQQLKPSKCSLYSSERCPNCSSNRGIVLMKRFDPDIESMRANHQIKSYWNSVRLPHISEIHRITQSQSQHLLTTNTSQLISNKVTRKVRSGPGRRPSGDRPRFSWSEVNANRLSNVHILPILESSSQQPPNPF